MRAKGARQDVRSIPACAGEPRAGAVPAIPNAVYPRVCGGTAYSRLLM